MVDLTPIERRGAAGYDQPRDTYTMRLNEVETKIVQGLAKKLQSQVVDVAGRFAFAKLMNRYPDFAFPGGEQVAGWHLDFSGFGGQSCYVLVVPVCTESHLRVQSPNPAGCDLIAVVTHRGGSTFEFEGWVYVKGRSPWCRWQELDGVNLLKLADLRAASGLIQGTHAGKPRTSPGEIQWNGKDMEEPFKD